MDKTEKKIKFKKVSIAQLNAINGGGNLSTSETNSLSDTYTLIDC